MSKYQIPGYQINPNDTLHKRGKDAPNVPLHEIQKQLLEYLGTIKDVRKAKEKIEEKYSIKNGLWSVSHIKKAWGKTQRMDWPHENKRKYWSIVIIMQMLQQSNINILLQQHHPDRSTKSKKRPNSKENTSQNSDLKKPKYHTCKQNDKNTKIKNGSEGILIPLFMFQNTEPPLAMEDTDHISRIKLLNGEPTFQNIQVPTRYQLLKKTSHVVKYDNETNNAAWVFEILNKETIDGPATVQSEYRLDYSTHKDHRAPESLKKYTETGFQRGHLAAAANHKWCQKARDDTNLLSNIVPQHKDLNKRKWKRLEDLCRLYVQDEDYSKAYIYTGPLYCIEKYITEKGITEEAIVEKEKEKIESSMRDFMSKNKKALPTHFFKVIILEKDNGERDLKCYEMPNKIEEQEEQQQREEQRRRQREEEQRQRRQQIECIENKLSKNSRNIDYIERVSGLRFTEEIPENLRNRKVVVTVEFKTEEEQKNIPNVNITPRHHVRSEM